MSNELQEAADLNMQTMLERTGSPGFNNSRDWDHPGVAVDLQEGKDQIEQMLSGNPNAVVLDVCCGTGKTLQSLYQTYPDIRGIGVELLPEVAAQARGKGLEILNRSADQIALAPRSVDVAYSVYGMPYVPDKVAALEKIYAALIDGGFAAIGLPVHGFSGAVHRRCQEDSDFTWSRDYQTIFITKEGKGLPFDGLKFEKAFPHRMEPNLLVSRYVERI